MSETALLIVLGVAAIGTVAGLYAIAQALALLRRPRALVERGEWGEAQLAAAELGESWLRVFRSVREDAAYARAACLHLEGKLDESLEVLRELPAGERGRLAGPARLLEGANLVMADRNPARAVECLTFACAPPRVALPEDFLFLALAELMANNDGKGEDAFARAGRKRSSTAPSPSIYEPAFHYLRARYLVKTDRGTEAAPELEAAAAGAVTTIYVERARALAAPKPRRVDDADLDPRASLSPQVIDEGQTRSR